MNPNITPSFSENSISSCYGISKIVIVVLIRSVPRCYSDSTLLNHELFSFCIGFQPGWLTSVSICLSSIPQMKFWSEYFFLVDTIFVLSCWYHFCSSCLLFELLFLLAIFQSLSLCTVSSYWDPNAQPYSLLNWVWIFVSYRFLWALMWD